MKTSFPEVIDSSIISAFRSCGQKANLEYFQHFRPKSLSVHLHAGKAFAEGLETARKAFYDEGRSEEDAIALGFGALLKAYGDFETPDDSAKSADRMAAAYEYTMHQYRISDPGVAYPILLPSGKHAIEFSFVEPIDYPHPETGQPLLFSGRFDMIVGFGGGVFGEDDKTTSSLGASWSKQWDTRSQFTAYCLIGETEVLTPNGWKRIDNLSEDTPVMQWGAGQMSFTVPEKYHKYDYKGKMHHFDGKVSFVATPDHRMLVYDAYSDSYKTFTATDLPRNSGALRFISAGWKQDGYSIDEKVLQLLVAIQADGSWIRDSKGTLTGVRFHFTKTRKFERLEGLLSSLKMQRKYWNTADYSLRVDVDETLGAIEALIGKDKLYGPWLLQLSGESIRIILDELLLWDGYQAGKVYCTSIPQNAEWIMTAAALCGMRGSLVRQPGYSKKGSTVADGLKVYYTDTHKHSVHLHSEKLIDFDGPVYCLTVPSSYFLIRHNGRISVTGNCWGAQRGGLPLQGFLVRGTSILKTKFDTQQAITYRPSWMIERWYEQLLRDVKRMEESWRSGVWDFNLDESCNSYGGCVFRKICLSKDPTAWLEQDFSRRRWDPVRRLEIPIVEAE